MVNLADVGLKLLTHTVVGRRQLATVRILLRLTTPIERDKFIGAVESELGFACYGSRQEYTLAADIRALKDAGVPVRYSRSATSRGYYVPSPEQLAAEEAARLLKKIGWHRSDHDQIAAYARLTPARKVKQMLDWRRTTVRLLVARLRRDHPTATARELSGRLREELALLSEERVDGS